CPLITNIPHIKGLLTLWCVNCPLIASIPQIEGLQGLICSYCPSIGSFTTSIPYSKMLKCVGCNWLDNNYYNPEFHHNIKKLKRLQVWFKSILLGKRLKKIIFEIIPLYYHPLAKGGYLHKR